MSKAVAFWWASFTAAVCLNLAACTSTQISSTAPTGTKCQVNVSNSTPSFNSTGGSGTLSVSAERDCQWSVASDTSWVSINGASSGQGDASVSYVVAANSLPSPRSGTLAIASTTIQLSQAAAPCLFTLASGGSNIGVAGGGLSVALSTQTGCSWTATPADAWIAVTGGRSGSGPATVSLSVSANAGAARSGRVIVGGQTYTVTQDGVAPPSPTPTPTPTPPPTSNPPSPPPSDPTPTPTPPPPPPPPPPPKTVHLDGSAIAITGRCPTLRFLVMGTLVVTDGSTDYPKKSKCRDVHEGSRVTVDGVADNNGTVKATTVAIKNDDDDG
ncbi:MAG TPA: BACON domain-containing carbohydrate-binding protein [Vicinamibacterales bacterium]